ncbi:ABC-type multidrug transport system, permease component [Longilinea arvoryzae]|uniref:ABC-type multidrug transport system, permease component n=1 Tax=Longilinea arvoryzae TaxID=360412 RepID=A0A0S7B784_9CHLR|nr:ABC transporter permease [Longilinea arvoryzae]GAP12999.1 ABC-type multidrug transport system, permease component [Longilinea arvoryzae]
MKKIFLIAWKDLTLNFRDRAAIILMLLAPFVLTLGLGLVTGGFSTSSSSSGISAVPLAVVNQDEGELGGELVNVFQSEDLADLLQPEVSSDPAAARARVDADEIAAAVVIPAGFSAGVIPDPVTGQTGPAVAIEIYANPTRPNSSGIVESIVEQFVNQVEIGRVGAQVAVSGLIQTGRIQPQDAAVAGAQIGSSQAQNAASSQRITLKGVQASSSAPDFNVLAYMAPGMALMFLMYTVSHGGRTLLVEKTHGTLPRLLVAPVNTGQVLLGKMFGIFLTGVAQMLILIITCSLLFQLKWGDPLAVLILVLACVAGAVGWGMLITALVKSPGQAASFGSAVMLIFGILGGSFFDVSQLPGWFRAFSRITPNAWGLDGFTALAMGDGLVKILPDIGGLLVMGLVLFGISLFLFKRRGVLQG